MYAKIAKDTFGGKYVEVYCHSCFKSKTVNTENSLRLGWQKCCGYTMSLDKPIKPPVELKVKG